MIFDPPHEYRIFLVPIAVLVAVLIALPLQSCVESAPKPDAVAKKESVIQLPNNATAEVIQLPSGERIFVYEKKYPGDGGGAIGCCLLPPLEVEKRQGMPP